MPGGLGRRDRAVANKVCPLSAGRSPGLGGSPGEWLHHLHHLTQRSCQCTDYILPWRHGFRVLSPAGLSRCLVAVMGSAMRHGRHQRGYGYVEWTREDRSKDQIHLSPAFSVRRGDKKKRKQALPGVSSTITHHQSITSKTCHLEVANYIHPWISALTLICRWSQLYGICRAACSLISQLPGATAHAIVGRRHFCYLTVDDRQRE
ncbi:hypothetical protein B0H66DRAFT_550999 [Apodospora peruviana]|uniref:Uncharacterized protein n=1 Tax=Apodospora peruviana TaxID=516989 RepID=A0AAE0IJV0_9PEZI|nr:hypothetical protein B0H66DRAFT_550999 [Apodospora peruviana]